jgi:hypothetical protein
MSFSNSETNLNSQFLKRKTKFDIGLPIQITQSPQNRINNIEPNSTPNFSFNKNSNIQNQNFSFKNSPLQNKNAFTFNDTFLNINSNPKSAPSTSQNFKEILTPETIPVGILSTMVKEQIKRVCILLFNFLF